MRHPHNGSDVDEAGRARRFTKHGAAWREQGAARSSSQSGLGIMFFIGPFLFVIKKALILHLTMARTAEGRAGGCGLGDSSMKADGGDDSEDDHASTDEGRPLTQEDAEVVKRTPCRAQSFAAVALVSICALLVVGWAAAQTAGLSTPPPPLPPAMLHPPSSPPADVREDLLSGIQSCQWESEAVELGVYDWCFGKDLGSRSLAQRWHILRASP